MNRIIGFSLKNKFAVWLLTIIVTAAGLYSGLNMKLETIPNINTPLLTITSVYPGATPQQVADKLSEPMEKKLQNLNGVSSVSSSSFQNVSSLQVEYGYEKNMDEAKREAEEALSSLELPDGAEEPEVSRLSLNAFPVIVLSASSDKESLENLTKKAEEDLLPSFEGLDGVGSVQLTGQQVEEGQLVFKKSKLEQYGLDEETVQNMIKGSDVTSPLGLYTFGNTEKSVVVDGNVSTIEDLKNIDIPVVPNGAGQPSVQQSAPQQGSAQAPPQQGASQNPGQPQQAGTQTAPQQGMSQAPPAQDAKLPTVKLGEIADVKIVGKAESISRTNGKESIGFQVIKSDDANTVDVVNAVEKQVEKLEKDYPGVHFTSTFDQGEPIEESVNTMLSKALFGAGFAVLIILLFLRNIRTTIISVISIPLSLLIAILILNQMDITLNIMTLGAMTVAIGRVVDDSIVVIENIFRRMALKNEPLKGKELIKSATKEMFVPIMSSTIVTIAVFLPLGLVKGMIGELFLPFALTIVFSLLASLLVAITIVPMMAHSFFKKGLSEKHHKEEKPGKLSGFYRNVLNWSLNHKWITSGIAVLLLVGSLALVPLIGVSFLPDEEQKMVMATYNPEPGQTREESEKIALDAEKFFNERKGAETIQYSLGGENPMNPGAQNQALFFVQYNDDYENFEKEKEKVIEELQKRTSKGEWASQSFSSSGSSNSLEVFVNGDSIDDIKPVVADVEKIMKDNRDLENVESGLSKTYDEYTLAANQKKLSELGLTAGQIGMELSRETQRPVVTTIKKDGKDINVYLQAEEEKLSGIEDLTDKKIMSSLGREVAIKDVVQVKEGSTSDTITRRDGKISVSVLGNIKADNVGKVSAAVQEKINDVKEPAGVSLSMGGVSEDIQESFSQLGLAMLAAIAIVYLILVITFGGGLAPFAILFSLPFTIIGALAGLYIAGETISISSMIGALMLIGIVVTNAIVLIDRVIHKENEGIPTREAILEAGTTRLRPILMTAIATIGALAPLALGLEGSGLISKGLGITVIGGLTSSTLLTLLIVPIVYEVLSKFRKRKQIEME
ncbi:AcrB/AcrD/AcrF family protein [Bacillus sp. FJAT-42376]|uniref:efflux RND transporter permease subunit n=1 Tax=Bacillus sp. FJAT-42376 TaxID=2014076 RepID=UPI000F4EFDED|nr:efflux RND transporter permease subunit [Bacillus sp. FJAT-42376]AZB40987.1 AcrB/AcrD/AcrF family protein [Bacillus sp. FJAT-42376]